jgi:hypothetical protein
VLTLLRASADIGPDGALDLLIRQYGTESIEYTAFLAAIGEHGFGENFVTLGVARAEAAVEPHVQRDCASATELPAAPATSDDSCVVTVLTAFEEIAASGDYTAGGTEIIMTFGTQSGEFAAYNQLQPVFVGAMMDSGAAAALREIEPRASAICRESMARISGGEPAHPRGTASVEPEMLHLCAPELVPTLRDVVEGNVQQTVAESRIEQPALIELLREAVLGAGRYQQDGLTRDEAIDEASAALLYHCPS